MVDGVWTGNSVKYLCVVERGGETRAASRTQLFYTKRAEGGGKGRLKDKVDRQRRSHFSLRLAAFEAGKGYVVAVEGSSLAVTLEIRRVLA